jgi:hypothetical protein
MASYAAEIAVSVNSMLVSAGLPDGLFEYQKSRFGYFKTAME